MASTIIADLNCGGKVRCHRRVVEKLNIAWGPPPLKPKAGLRGPSSKVTDSKPIPHLLLPFKEVMADVLNVRLSRKQNPGSKHKGA
jgi:hypothetical protein